MLRPKLPLLKIIVCSCDCKMLNTKENIIYIYIYLTYHESQKRAIQRYTEAKTEKLNQLNLKKDHKIQGSLKYKEK